jgi:2-polyprenyl-6-hydroxyphenyl methylase/3-demethylubiquinone-9 3-methyltransferase
MSSYYTGKLSAGRLRRCYELAPPRVQRYLLAEILHIREKILPENRVLELGCGYGRVLQEIVPAAKSVIGIDIAAESLRYARRFLVDYSNCHLFLMDSGALAFADGVFDRIICIQNGISAFRIEPSHLIRESLRVMKKGGTAFFTSYTDPFWDDRLLWFRLQAHEGLVGEIDEERTGDGVIICQDGFRSTTFRREDFLRATAALPCSVEFEEVDSSSLFCEIKQRDIK